jgi:hypothetical protein
MSNYSVSHRVNGSDLLLNGRLEAIVGVLYPGYCGSPVMAHKFEYDWSPPAANGWETTYPVLDTAPPLLIEGEGSPT